MGRSRGAGEEDHAPSGGSRPNRCRYATTSWQDADTMSFPLVREDWTADEEMLLLEFLRAADGQDAPETPLGRAAGEQRGERQVQLGALCEKTTPRSSGGSPSPRRPISGERAPLRTLLDALFRLDHCPPAAHVAHGHLHSSARAIAGETACAGAGGLEIGPRDEESRAAGALTAAANVQTGTDGERREEQAIGDASNRDRVNGDNVTDGLEIGSSMPRDEANVASVAMAVTVEIEAWCDVPHNGSPARRHAPPLNGDEANAPGAPQPPHRSARRTPCAQAPVRAADPQSGAGSDQ
ncbi:unnamed protein product [Closterium sp. NIES-65]|nr:unnamed protein product [Closterium sp. NIES-65]